ncbi:MAG: polyprenyl synthetase family protein [Leucobacter sp.]
MDETTRLAGLIQERLNDIISGHREALIPLGADSMPLIDEALGFLTGGKRFRALFAVHGFNAVQPLDMRDAVGPQLSALLNAACALELFHAAALIHDDIIDRSDTRRGRPAVHRRFEALHHEQGLRGPGAHFGISSSILLGDLLQSWADEAMNDACDEISDRQAARATREHFNRMRSEVALGQYLDVLEEQRAGFAEHAEQLDRSTRVLVYKSAKYSVEAPLLIGGALAGADEAQEDALSGFGLPVGVAFQLRDDLLGVFGNEQLTGKPSGDDLVEGKRTVLITLTREALPSSQRRILDGMLGTELDAAQVAMLQRTIRESGAEKQVEQMIGRNIERARDAIDGASLDPTSIAKLTKLAERAAQRSA